MPALPAKMREIHFTGGGGPEVIALRQADVPAPPAGKVLIEVVAAGINRPDCIQRAGLYPPPPGESQIPGLEIGGRVVALGAGVENLSLGEEVCALVGSGGYAEYCLADAALCLPRPKPLDSGRGGRNSGKLFHGLRQRLHARTPRVGRNFSHPRRIERDRLNSDPVGQAIWRKSLRDGGFGRENPILQDAWRRRGDQLPDPRLRHGDQGADRSTRRRRHSRHGRRSLSAKEFVGAGSGKGAWCRSPFCRARGSKISISP